MLMHVSHNTWHKKPPFVRSYENIQKASTLHVSVFLLLREILQSSSLHQRLSSQDPASAKGNSAAVCAAQRKPRILLAACGCVAAVKFGILCHCFSEWAEVRAVVTRASMHFVDKESIPKVVPVYTDEHEWFSWKTQGDSVIHLELHSWADIMVIAPLSANTLGKIAGGLSDNLLTCIVRVWDYGKPLFVAPSMDIFMWENSSTEQHCISIDELGISLIPPITTRSPCGKDGNCAMAEPSSINGTIRHFYELKILKKNTDILPPEPSNTKGCGKRIKGGKEKAMEQQKRRRLCKACNQYGYHNSRTCPEKSSS